MWHGNLWTCGTQLRCHGVNMFKQKKTKNTEIEDKVNKALKWKRSNIEKKEKQAIMVYLITILFEHF